MSHPLSKYKFTDELGHPLETCVDYLDLVRDAQIIRDIRVQERERCATAIQPTAPRPCDCEVCDCGNRDDAEAVAVWDAETATANLIRAIK